MADTPTTVTINGTSFELKGMSAEDGARLYAELGKLTTKTNYVALADTYKQLALNFKSIENLDLPKDMTYQKLVDGFSKALRDGNGSLKNNADKMHKDLLATDLGRYIVRSGAYKTTQKVVAIGDALGHVVTGMGRVPSGVVAVASAVIGTGSELGAQAGFSPSDAQATAIGAAYAAAFYAQNDAPDSPAETRTRAPNLIDKGIARATYWLDSVQRMLPPKLTAYWGALINFVSNGFSDWKGSYAMALKESEDARKAPLLTYEQTLAKQVAEAVDKAARPEAAKIIEQAEVIAGMSTQPLADVVKHGAAVYRGQDGTFNGLTFPAGTPASEPLKDDKGTPLTIENRIGSQWKEALHILTPENGYEAVGMGVTSALAVAVEQTRVAPIKRLLNGATATIKVAVTTPIDAGLGLVSGAVKGGTSLVARVIPSRKGPEAALAANAEIVEKAAVMAEKQARALAATKQMEADAVEKLVQEAVKAAKTEAAQSLKPRGAWSRAFDPLRSLGDKVRSFGTGVEVWAANLSHGMHNGADALQAKLHVDTRTAAQKVADSAAEAARAAVTPTLEAAAAKPPAPTLREHLANAKNYVAEHAMALKDRVMNRGNVATPAPASEAAKAAEKVSKTVVKEVAKDAAQLGVVFRLASRAGKLVPLLGVGFTGATVAFAGSAHADTVDGEKLNYFKQLTHDHDLGKITDKQYTYYRGLQTTYIASGLGGFITAGLTETAQNGLEYADPVNMDKYLPESIVTLVRGLIKSDKPVLTGALPADAGLAAAGVEAEQKMQAAQRIAQAAATAEVKRRGFAVANTSLGAVLESAPDTGASLAAVHGKLEQQHIAAN